MGNIPASALIEKFRSAIEDKWGYIWGTAGILWTTSRQNQKVTYMAEKYGAGWKSDGDAKKDNYYYAAKDGAKWVGHTVADCSGLFVWAFRQFGGSIYHGSNTMYKSYCSAKGKLSGGKRGDGQELKPGTAVFTGTESSHGHVGLYVGDGKVIEASGTNAGCVVSEITLRKWTFWGELKDVEYGDAPSPVPVPVPEPSEPDDDGGYPVLKLGSKGKYVSLAQSKLVNKGYSVGSCGIDGVYGKDTEAAVKQFQADWGLVQDGIIGTATWDILTSDVRRTTYTVRIPYLTSDQAEALIQRYPGSSKEIEGR